MAALDGAARRNCAGGETAAAAASQGMGPVDWLRVQGVLFVLLFLIVTWGGLVLLVRAAVA